MDIKIDRYLWSEIKNSTTRLERPSISMRDELVASVKKIVATVKESGDVAVRKFTADFDNVELGELRVDGAEIDQAMRAIDNKSISAIEKAFKNIELFHKEQITGETSIVTSTGVRCVRKATAIERVGLYVPGGNVPLPSTVLMVGVPSLLAGCERRIMCTPPRPDGSVDPYILAAAKICQIEEIYKIGGAQAIAAMAFGTETIPKVDKVFGPGNQWVTQAKVEVSNDPQGAAFDMPAGPSEVLVIADESASAEFVAADLLSQAEHGSDSQVVLVSTSEVLFKKVEEQLSLQIDELSAKETAAKALSSSAFVLVSSVEEGVEVSNFYAPEHLILQVVNPWELSEKITNAGSVFVGEWTPESAGDYASGTNHILPTYGWAKSYSGLSVSCFQKQITFQELTVQGIKDLGPVIEEMATIEGLDGHKNAVSLRLSALREGGER